MPNNDKLSLALKRVYKTVESKGKIHILQTKEMSRADREILTRSRWLQEIIRGWYMLIRPDIGPGETSAWYANYWDFVRVYLEHHYGDEYCLSAEHSLDLHIGKTTVPKQLVVMAKTGNGIPITLPYDTSLLVYSGKEHIPEERVKIRNINVMSLPYALCKVTPSYFLYNEEDAEIALLSNQDPSELIHILIKYNFLTAAGRIIGAYTFLGKTEIANLIKRGMAETGIAAQEHNPFKREEPYLLGLTPKSPYSARIELMWARYRDMIVSIFPKPPGLPVKSEKYLKSVEEIHRQDAYHSLSIEGYQVSMELIRKVEQGEWNPDEFTEDAQYRNAMAAKGYYEAFLEVKKSISKVIEGEGPGKIVQDDLPIWFKKLFLPSVDAKILRQEDLWGYRHHQVYIRNSRHTPFAKEYLLDAMETFFNCLNREEHAAVRAVLGHFIFVYIHPYMDGNGRIGRFLMNVMLASGGYPWTVIKVENRNEYFKALETASVDKDIIPFVKFIASQMQ